MWTISLRCLPPLWSVFWTESWAVRVVYSLWKAVCSARRGCWSRVVLVEVLVVVEEVGWGGLLHKLTHISPLRPWVLPAPSGSVGWICRSFHGPLIFKMGLCSGQREVSEKYWPVRERTGSGYQRLPAVTSGYQRILGLVHLRMSGERPGKCLLI